MESATGYAALRLGIDPIAMNDLPLDTADLRLHAAIDIQEMDPMLEVYLLSAIEEAEGFMHRTIVQRTHRWTLNHFPYGKCQEIRLPRGKTVSVDGISYSNGGVITTLTGPSASPIGTGFTEDLTGDDGGVVAPVYGGSWPNSDLDVPSPVVIEFTAGYAADAVPAQILHWLYFAVSDAFLHRDTGGIVSADTRCRVMTALLSPLMLHREYVV